MKITYGMKSLPTLPLIAKYTREQPRFTLLDSVQNRLSLIAFCSVFSFLFMYIFLPFNINMWYEGQHLSLVQLFGIFTACGMAAMGVSQFLLFRLKWRQQLTNTTYLTWFLAEVLLVTASIVAVDVLLTDTFFFTWQEFINTFRYTALILPLPYCIALLWFYTREKIARLKSLESAPPQPQQVPAREACLLICDEHDKPVLTLHPDRLLLIKAEDNYVHVFYVSGSGVSKELVRNSLKKLETRLSANGFIRAHRSYLVNISKVVLFKKNTKGHYLQLEGLEDISVPVSVTCLPALQQHFAPAS
jgi:hypothetical protein